MNIKPYKKRKNDNGLCDAAVGVDYSYCSPVIKMCKNDAVWVYSSPRMKFAARVCDDCLKWFQEQDKE